MDWILQQPMPQENYETFLPDWCDILTVTDAITIDGLVKALLKQLEVETDVEEPISKFRFLGDKHPYNTVLGFEERSDETWTPLEAVVLPESDNVWNQQQRYICFYYGSAFPVERLLKEHVEEEHSDATSGGSVYE